MVKAVLALLIPLLAVVMGIGVAMLDIYLNYRKRKELFTLYHQERMAAIEKGIDLPPMPEAFFSEDTPRPQTPRRDLFKGLVWLFIGLAVGVAVFANDKPKEALIALIPGGIGLAYLIYYFVESRHEPGPPRASSRTHPNTRDEDGMITASKFATAELSRAITYDHHTR